MAVSRPLHRVYVAANKRQGRAPSPRMAQRPRCAGARAV